MGIFAVGSKLIPLDYCWSESFDKQIFPYRVVYYFVAAFPKRSFYYSPFSATTGAIIASGFGYNGIKTVKEKEVH